MLNAAVPAPLKPTSSWTVPTAINRAVRFLQQFQGFHHDGTSNAVVEGSPDDDVVADLRVLLVKANGVANSYALFVSVVLAFGPNVDEEFVESEIFLRSSSFWMCGGLEPTIPSRGPLPV